MLTIGNTAPDFTLPASDGSEVTLSKQQGKWVVLYFYPKDMTPGCTTQACDFRDYSADYAELNTVVFGVSRDPLSLHKKFVDKHDLNFLLLSDEDEQVCHQYEVIKEKNMFGKKVMGIERSTLVINPEGKVATIYRKVKVKDHVPQVLAFIKEQQGK